MKLFKKNRDINGHQPLEQSDSRKCIIIPTNIEGVDKSNFRIKEYIMVYDGVEKHTYSPQFNIKSLKKNERVDHHGSSLDFTDDKVGCWVNLSRNAFNNIDEAKEICYNMKIKHEENNIVYHNL